MRKLIVKVLLVSTLFTTLSVSTITQAKEKNIRTMKAKVVEVKDGNVLFETTDGNYWYLEDIDGYKVNQKYKIKFDTMGTKTIYDDEIIKVTKVK